ncbi:hypothetical protein Dda_4353 [Drechslerella dactyloides]|uniref:Uncharacterized protein n=1 Tax=Drechslerella dactyloides TaxID=74499 RepID=A0AAD6IXF4_DREDA|nr:hypothetical protein Dda_4353 [Drechslerella dactyloides]
MSSSAISTAKLRDTLAKAPRNSAYARHIQKCLQYVDFYGGSAPVVAKGKTERDLLEEEFQFLRDDDGGEQHTENTAKEIAKKYYDNLFREFALIDLSRWREGQVALRWRTKQEVLQGLGQFTCASLTCPRHAAPSDEPPEFDLDADEDDSGNVKLETFEMNFGYAEKGIKKNALVKVSVCEKCAGKLRRVKGSKDGKDDGNSRRDGDRNENSREQKRRSKERRDSDDRDRRHHRRRNEEEEQSSKAKYGSSYGDGRRDYEDEGPMTDWKALGYVPDSEGEDDDDLLLSPPIFSVHAATQQPTEPQRYGEGSGSTKSSQLAVYDFPSSSAEPDSIPLSSRGRGRGRPPRRGRGAKRMSAGGSHRPKKQARIEKSTDAENGPSIESTLSNISLSQDGDTVETVLPHQSSSQHDLTLPDAPQSDYRDPALKDGLTSPPPKSVISQSGSLDGRPTAEISASLGSEIERVDLVDHHGADSEPEDAAPLQPVPPSSPPQIPRIVPPGSSIGSPAPTTPASVKSLVEVRMLTPHTGLTDPATAMNTQGSSDGPQITADDFTIGVSRNLRQRKPIQLNPYLLEEQKYTSVWKSRGLKPIKYVYSEPAQRPHNRDTRNDSQEDEWTTPGVNDEEETQTGGAQTQSFQSILGDDPASSQISENDTLPALDELYRLSNHERPPSPGAKNTSDGNKRQKTQHLFQPSARTKRIMAAAKASLTRGQNSANEATAAPRTPKTPSAKTKEIFSIFDLESSDPEPLLSSAPASAPRRRVAVDSDESQDERENIAKPRSPSSSQESDTSNASDASEPPEPDSERREKEITRLQRKVRGVLPASYLRLNQSATDTAAQAQARNAHLRDSPERRPMVRGMATMRIRSRASPPPGLMANPLGLSSGESSEEDAPPPAETPRFTSDPFSVSSRPSASMREPRYSRDYAFEDDTIDRMLSRPSGSKSRSSAGTKSSKPKRLKQSKLDGGSSRQGQSRATRYSAGQQRPRVRPAALSIVDACKRYRDTRGSKPPQFMMIAERRAKKRKDSGRHLPDRKVIKIDRLLDEETDGEDTLTRWRRAKLARSSSSGSLTSTAAPPPRGISNQPAPGFSKKPNIFTKHPTYLQTKILNSNQAVSSSSGSGPAKSQLISKPIAILPRRGQSRIDQIAHRLQQRVIDDPIKSSTPEGEISHNMAQQRQLTDRSRTAWINRPPEQYFVNARSEVFNKDGKLPPNPVRRPRKAVAPKRIDRRKSPVAFQPPERAMPALLVMDIDPKDDGELLFFENMPPMGTRFSNDFDIAMPKSKSLFGVTTFLGSGSLFRALKTPTGGLSSDSRARTGSQDFFGENVDWDVYDEGVGSQLETCISRLLRKAEELFSGTLSQVDHSETILDLRRFFGYVVDYLSTSVCFSDLIDIAPFAARFLDVLSDTLSKVTSLDTIDGSTELVNLFKGEIYSYVSIILEQIKSVLGNESIAQKVRIEALQVEVLDRLISILMTSVSELQKSMSKTSLTMIRHGEIDHEAIRLESWIIAYHTSQLIGTGTARKRPFWQAFNEAVGLTTLKRLKDIETFESAWRTLFRLLPLSTIDSWGKISSLPDDRFLPENWQFAHELIGQVFYIYNAAGVKQQKAANGYIKTLLNRCLILLRDWRWANAELIIAALYDFLAKRGLNNLPGETDLGPPKFLQHLDTPTFDLNTSETSFTIFLKIVALGMHGLKRSSGDRVVNGLIIRLLPNHGRTLLKEEELPQVDLDNLRNQHDLMTAVYFGVGHASKKRVISHIRRLVNPETSHSQVCTLSLKTWSNIITFELADDKKPDILETLMDWHARIIHVTILLVKELKVQADQARRAAFDETRIETINRMAQANKRSLESILSTAVGLLDLAFRSPNCDFYSAQLLLVSDSIKALFSMSHSLPQKLIAEVVNVISSHVRVCKNFGFSTAQDESQTWAGFDNAESDEIRKEAGKQLLDEIFDPLFQLINTYFATEETHLDQVLIPCIQVWIELGSLLVQCGLKSWGDYFNAYRKNWFSMVDTDNKKTYSVSYVANIMRIDSSVYDTHKSQILQVWLSSLVERGSLLKFQHELTSIVFNYDLSNVLFANMPFEVDPELECYRISLKDFKDRRLSLVSTLLENMQKYILRLQISTEHRQLSNAKMEYSRMLQDMMNAMKSNYTEIQLHDQTAAASARAVTSYVNFCQQVVELLQQYGTDICPIDKFFVDSVTFPLPANDPIYVTSKLKGYALKLGKSGGFTSFVQFFQNTCGRVAAEGQQGYFVEQIFNALESQSEREGKATGRATLREVCVLAVFGTYTRRSVDSLPTLVLAAPIVVVAKKIVRGLARELDGLEEEREMDKHISGLLITLLDAAVWALERCIENGSAMLSDPMVIYVVGLLVQLVCECDRMVNSMCPRMTGVSDGLLQDLIKVAVRSLSRLRACLRQTKLPGKLDAVMFQTELPFRVERQKFNEEFRRELKSWKVEGDREVVIQRLGGRKTVQWRHLPPDSTVDVSKTRLIATIEGVLAEASRGVCEGTVLEADEMIWDRARRPMMRLADILFGVRQAGAEEPVRRDADADTAGFFDMDD